jgi:hypothetical protein
MPHSGLKCLTIHIDKLPQFFMLQSNTLNSFWGSVNISFYHHIIRKKPSWMYHQLGSKYDKEKHTSPPQTPFSTS